MKTKEANALNFYEARRLQSPLEHFESINLPVKYNLEDSLARWITDNLKNRFFIIKTLDVDNNNEVRNILSVGFEDPKELSYFTLACPYLKYN